MVSSFLKIVSRRACLDSKSASILISPLLLIQLLVRKSRSPLSQQMLFLRTIHVLRHLFSLSPPTPPPPPPLPSFSPLVVFHQRFFVFEIRFHEKLSGNESFQRSKPRKNIIPTKKRRTKHINLSQSFSKEGNIFLFKVMKDRMG